MQQVKSEKVTDRTPANADITTRDMTIPQSCNFSVGRHQHPRGFLRPVRALDGGLATPGTIVHQRLEDMSQRRVSLSNLQRGPEPECFPPRIQCAAVTPPTSLAPSCSPRDFVYISVHCVAPPCDHMIQQLCLATASETNYTRALPAHARTVMRNRHMHSTCPHPQSFTTFRCVRC